MYSTHPTVFPQSKIKASSNSQVVLLIYLCLFGLLTKHEVKMAVYWPSSFWSVYGNKQSLGLSIKTQKKNEANIQQPCSIWLSENFFLAGHSG